MADIGGLNFNMDANTIRLERKLDRVEKQVRRNSNSMRRSMDRAFSGIQRQARLAVSALGAFASVQTVRGIVDAGLAMERIRLGLTAATGSAEGAAREMQFLRDESERLGLSLEQVAGSYVKLSAASKGTILEGQETRKIFTAISEASVVLGLTAEQTSGALTAIEQIMSKGKVSAEELRGQLGERLAGAFFDAANAIGVTTAELDDLLKQGKLASTSFLPRFADEISRKYRDQIPEAVNTARASFERFQTAIFELKAAIAESGLLDALSDMAAKIAKIINPNATRTIADVEADIANVLKNLERAKRNFNDPFLPMFLGGGFIQGNSAADIEAFNAQLTELYLELERLQLQARRVDFGDNIREQVEQIDIADKLLKELSIESKLDAILRPGEVEDIERKQRASEAYFKSLIDAAEETKEVNELAQTLGLTFQSAFEDAILEGEKFSDILKAIGQDIARLIIRQGVTNPFVNFIGGLFDSFGGARAGGGPVSSGSAYLVGEEGPELFVPGASGMVLPHGMAAAGGMAVSYQINIDSRADREQIRAELAPLLDRTVEYTRALERRDRLEGNL